MITQIRVELLKMKRSMALWVCLGAPSGVMAIIYLVMNRRGSGQGRIGAWPLSWEQFAKAPVDMWAFFMFPMVITALSIMLSQIEHTPKAWNYVLAAPTPRWRLFLAKTLVMLTMTAAMTLILYLLIPLAGTLRDLTHKPMIGAFDWQGPARKLSMIYAGGMLPTAIQTWVALRFRNFAVPLSVGIGGWFVAIAFLFHAMTTGERDLGLSVYVPWMMPADALSTDPDIRRLVWFGLAGGIAVFAGMIADLSRKEVA